MIRAWAAFLGMALTIVASASASPILTVDQENLVGEFDSGLFALNTGPGQSFRPTLSMVDAFDVSLRAPLGPSTARLDLFLGEAGFGGPFLGSSALVTFSNTTKSLIHFDLLTPIALSLEFPYTFRVVYVAGEFFTAGFGTDNPYGGGTAFNAGGQTAFGVDMVFREGLHAATVPEPATLSLLGLAFASLAACRRRGQHKRRLWKPSSRHQSPEDEVAGCQHACLEIAAVSAARCLAALRPQPHSVSSWGRRQAPHPLSRLGRGGGG